MSCVIGVYRDQSQQGLLTCYLGNDAKDVEQAKAPEEELVGIFPLTHPDIRQNNLDWLRGLPIEVPEFQFTSLLEDAFLYGWKRKKHGRSRTLTPGELLKLLKNNRQNADSSVLELARQFDLMFTPPPDRSIGTLLVAICQCGYDAARAKRAPKKPGLRRPATRKAGKSRTKAK